MLDIFLDLLEVVLDWIDFSFILVELELMIVFNGLHIFSVFKVKDQLFFNFFNDLFFIFEFFLQILLLLVILFLVLLELLDFVSLELVFDAFVRNLLLRFKNFLFDRLLVLFPLVTQVR